MANTPDPKTEIKTLTEEETKAISGGAEGDTPSDGTPRLVIATVNLPPTFLPDPNGI